MKKVRCLYRVSSKQQLHGDDIPLQRNECKAFIDKQPDWVFDDEYVEKGISGFKTAINDRDILIEISNDAAKSEFDILLVYMSDRIGRREGETPLYVSNLSNMGIEVWSVKEGKLKTEEHIDKLLNYIRFWQAEGESRKTGMRVKDAQIDRVKRGLFVGGYAPYGYQLVPTGEINSKGRVVHKLVIDEEKAPIVRMIFDYAVNYSYGAYKIAKVMNEARIPAIKSEEWKSGTISSILKNPIYMGYIAYGRRVNHGSFHKLNRDEWTYADEQNPDYVIVSQQIWEKAQELREARKAKIREGRDREHGPYPVSTSGRLLFMDMIYCGHCGKKLTNGSKYDYWTTKDGEKKSKIVGRYRCNNKASGSLQCEGKAFYRQEEIEPIILNIIKQYLGSLEQKNAYSKILETQERRRKEIEKQLADQNKLIDRIKLDIQTYEEYLPLSLRGENPVSAERMERLLHNKEDELVIAQQELSNIQNEYKKTLLEYKDLEKYSNLVINWVETFDNAPTAMKKTLLAKIIERIDIYNDEIKIKFLINSDELLPRITSGSGTIRYIHDSG